MENKEGERKEGKEEEGVAPQRAKTTLHTPLRMDIIHIPMTRYIHTTRHKGTQTTLHSMRNTPQRRDTPHTTSIMNTLQTKGMTGVMVVGMEVNLGVT